MNSLFSTYPTRSDKRAPSRTLGQRGSILINTAIALSLIVMTLIGTELGYMFFLKREFQKTADLAALAGAQALEPSSCTGAQAAAVANAALNLPSGIAPLTAANIECGRWDPIQRATAPHFGTPNTGEKLNAVRVQLSRVPPLLLSGIVGNRARKIEVEALAAQKNPRAVLNIRNTLLSVDPSRSALLNAVLGGLLGSNLSVDILGWRGLLNTNISLLSYLDQLAIDLRIGAGKYDQVLNTEVSAGVLLQAMITALNRSGGTATAVITALDEIRIKANAAAAQPLLKLGDLLGVQTGTDAAGLQTDLQIFQLVQGMIQLANKEHAVAASLPITVPGIASVTTRVQVVEAPQISAIGNPELAQLASDGPDRIQVQTAQIRSLIQVDLPALSGISGLLNVVTSLLTPVTSLLNNVLSLDLQAILCFSCTQTRIVLVPDNPVRISVNLNVASAKSKVTGVNCTSPTATTLTVLSRVTAAELRVGQISDADGTALLKTGATPIVQPIPVMDVETRKCYVLGLACDPWGKYSRTGLRVDTAVAGNSAPHTYQNPPELNAPPLYYSLSSTDIVGSLSETLSGLQLQTYTYNTSAPNHLGNLIGTATQLIQGALSLVQDLVTTLLSPLLDSLVNALLNALGIQLAQADIGARLSCTRGAELVF